MAFSKTSGAGKRRGSRREGFRLIAKTLFGLEEILAGELREMGAREVRVGNRVVEFSGDMETMYRANLWCRTATRILMPIRTFRAGDKDELYAGAARVFWDRYLDVGGTLAVDAVVSRSALNNSHYVALRVKDAIVDQFREKRGRRPSVDTDRPNVRVHIHVHENNATLALDSSGGPLGRRGYRTEAGEAPIGENLAAGIVALTEWDRTLPFVDGMCGSGTFAIEAAMKARRIAPGLCRREFGFMRWKGYQSGLFDRVKAQAREKIVKDADLTIVASDQSERRIREAMANARRAGVDGDIVFEKERFEHKTPPPGPGTLVMNPPWGDRMKIDDLAALYGMIGDRLKQAYDGYDAFIFTGSHQGAKRIGLRTSRRIRLFDPPLECRLLKFEMYRGSRKAKWQTEGNEEDE